LKKENKVKTVKQVWEKGRPEDLTPSQVVEIIQNLYDLKIAEPFFIGMGWIEGYKYCSNPEFLRKSYAPTALKTHRRQIWFACKYID
jgi:hypothetical protein